MNIIKAACKDFVVPEHIRQAANAATHNLYTGHSSIPFEEACDTVREWCENNIFDITDDDGDGMIIIESCDIKRELFGSELYPYIR